MSAQARSASLIVKLTAALLAVIGLTSVAIGITTTGGRPGYVYDAPTIARVDVHDVTGADAAETRLTAAPEGSAFRHRDHRGASMTSLARKNATEAASPGGKAIVIGEDMEGRVIPKANELGADLMLTRVLGHGVM